MNLSPPSPLALNIHPRPAQFPSSLRRSPTLPHRTRGPPIPPPPILLPKSLPRSARGAPAGDRGCEDTQRARKAAFVHCPQQLTLVTRSAMASSSPGSSSTGRSRARETPTSRGPEPTAHQQPFLRSTPGGAVASLRFKPRTALSLLVCSWHSLPSHWRLPVPPRMRFLGDPAETFERGRGEALALWQLCCHLERRAGCAPPTWLVGRGSSPGEWLAGGEEGGVL